MYVLIYICTYIGILILSLPIGKGIPILSLTMRESIVILSLLVNIYIYIDRLIDKWMDGWIYTAAADWLDTPPIKQPISTTNISIHYSYMVTWLE